MSQVGKSVLGTKCVALDKTSRAFQGRNFQLQNSLGKKRSVLTRRGGNLQVLQDHPEEPSRQV